MDKRVWHRPMHRCTPLALHMCAAQLDFWPKWNGIKLWLSLQFLFFMFAWVAHPCKALRKGGNSFPREQQKSLSSLYSHSHRFKLPDSQTTSHPHRCVCLNPIEASLCKAQPLKAIQSDCIRCQWDYTAFIHPSHPSLALTFPPASPFSPHFFLPTSSFSPVDNTYTWLTIIHAGHWLRFGSVLYERQRGNFHSLFLCSQLCLLLNWLQLTEERDTRGSQDKRHFGEEKTSEPTFPATNSTILKKNLLQAWVGGDRRGRGYKCHLVKKYDSFYLVLA